MRLPDSRWNFVARKTETIRTPGAFCFDDPKRSLRQSFFHVGKVESGKIKIQDAFCLSRELFCHQWLPAGDSSPIDMTLRFARHIVANSRKIIACTKLRQRPSVAPAHAA